MARFRQSFFDSPPIGPFTRNTNSIQSAGLVAWWPPLRFPGINYGIPDMAGSSNALQQGALGWVYDPDIGWAPDYVANTANFLLAGAGSALNPTTAMTISAWINPDNVANEQILVDRDTSGGRSYSLRIKGTKLYLLVGTTSSLNSVGPALSIGVPYLLMVSGDATQGWIGYVNGVYAGAGAWTAPAATASINRIGRGGYAYFELPFNGRIGDVRIYNRALSAAEVWQLYDPITRWELYQPARRWWTAGVTGAAPPAGRRRSWATIIG
jgi:hypothetical protein